MKTEKLRWLGLFYQLPLEPAYHRVKIWRRVREIGAIHLRNAIYLLPNRPATLEDFQWTIKEIIALGGEAALADLTIIDGMGLKDIIKLFDTERQKDFAALRMDVVAALKKKPDPAPGILEKYQKKFQTISAIDFFDSAAQKETARFFAKLQEKAKWPKTRTAKEDRTPKDIKQYRNRIWVTRKSVEIDRIC